MLRTYAIIATAFILYDAIIGAVIKHLANKRISAELEELKKQVKDTSDYVDSLEEQHRQDLQKINEQARRIKVLQNSICNMEQSYSKKQ